VNWSAQELELLEILRVTTESRSFREAATKLGLSQAAVSLKLKALERALGQPLFDEVGKRKAANAFARALCREYAPGMRDLQKRIEAAAANYQKPEALSLSIATRAELLTRLAPQLDFPGRLDFVVSSGREAIELLREQKVDVAFTYEKIDSPDFIAWPLLDSFPKFVVAKSLLPSRKSAEKCAEDAQFLRSLPCLVYGDKDALFHETMEHLEMSSLQPRKSIVIEDWRALLSFVAEGKGYSFVPGYLEVDTNRIASHEFRGRGVRGVRYHVVFRKTLLAIEAYATFLRALKN
jgi:DNA-binding transcriptional LysR family regulator